jgi:hypothetical protein
MPVWKGNLMNWGGRLALIKSTLSTILVHTTIVLKTATLVAPSPGKDHEVLLVVRRRSGSGGKCLVAWSRVQRLLNIGGLGGMDLNLFNMVLRMWWL